MNIKNDINSLLLQNNINMDSSIDFDVNGKLYTMSFEEIVENYMLASEESQLVFYATLQKSLSLGELGVESFFESMGKLLLMSQLSEMKLSSISEL
jgi:hypothetical protein